ncbi:PspC domain-containing protein [Nocardioides mangrovi]|uniref:PspC domain-containing protein n=1 Tax=Nocardioides mangrovi TaxID=2874580 RepID=A0ABS7UGJ8_9ACTN|nr:PspC domain-containing protein [Nocardioides mangrovi]MBZ5740163.1 PspC domain-containing protein [Nocardioides mangrovi]
MTTTPPEAPPPPQDPNAEAPHTGGPRVGRDQVRDLGRLRRSIGDRKVAGVAGGLARHLDVDPLVLRIAFVVLVFFGGAGIILYAACWLLVPEENSGRAALNLDDRSRTFALLIAGAVATLALLGDSWGAFWFPWPLAVVALIALWLLTRNGSSSRSSQGSTPPPPAAAPYGPQPAPPTYPAAPYAPSPRATAYTGPPAYVPPPTYVPPPRYVAPKPENPRKRGPVLFWFTVALIALAEGILGIVDLAGGSVADPAYPALAVAICGVMLLVGAFYGRAGGIIAIGLLASVGLAGATAAQEIDTDSYTATPRTAAEVQSVYQLDVGEQRVDLTRVADLDALDGRTITIDGDVGSIDLTLPHGLRATLDATVDGPGEIKLFGSDDSDWGVDDRMTVGNSGDPHVTIYLNLHVGSIEVTN